MRKALLPILLLRPFTIPYSHSGLVNYSKSYIYSPCTTYTHIYRENAAQQRKPPVSPALIPAPSTTERLTESLRF
ncbi:hypothetical protein BD769DRAFT_1005486 [Suillus cothurnatus]|nr:hypothetical protein BD769DRAFT_1005486 [Suillus cothurnatus]